ncbi:hypothetical protein M406DRAFT_74155 [Cryphonectria parasitica EP155]|uniref:Uncharacterized protein n=1 Tax=Cryphonectria parasitica (strain ATCC 38755 / EP155) TaxID=660469 RepID=A0A9P5CMY4_CRYP1|nr:uncharacterized protein M406DRAFT_74155 [Cryphonectria parasitica EP155]KAF3763566.1 hypothetical protein M406DRAFT_74155 [Cryphonectria parasitica EP155]
MFIILIFKLYSPPELLALVRASNPELAWWATMEPSKADTKIPASFSEPPSTKTQATETSTNSGQSPRAKHDIVEPVAPTVEVNEKGQPLTPRDGEDYEPPTSHDMMAIMAPTVHREGGEEQGNHWRKDD